MLNIIMCLSKSSVQMVNELTLMHAFLFAFMPFYFFRFLGFLLNETFSPKTRSDVDS